MSGSAQYVYTDGAQSVLVTVFPDGEIDVALRTGDDVWSPPLSLVSYEPPLGGNSQSLDEAIRSALDVLAGWSVPRTPDETIYRARQILEGAL